MDIVDLPNPKDLMTSLQAELKSLQTHSTPEKLNNLSKSLN